MKKRRIISLVMLVCAGVLIGAVGVAAVDGYSLDWWTADGGGEMNSSGDDYSLGGTIGQPDAGTSSGGPYTLIGGFWGSPMESETISNIYLPIVRR